MPELKPVEDRNYVNALQNRNYQKIIGIHFHETQNQILPFDHLNFVLRQTEIDFMHVLMILDLIV